MSRWRNLPHRGFDRLRLLRNRDDQLIVGEDRQLAMFLIAPHTVQAMRQPVRQRKVHSLVEVELNNTITNVPSTTAVTCQVK